MSREQYQKENQNQVVGTLINSIAKEEYAFGSIMYQEGRKIEKALTLSKCIDDLVKIDNSVQKTLKEITKGEILLLQKLQEAGELACKDCFCEE